MSKKVKINKALDEAVKKMVEDAKEGKLIRNETVAALKVAIQWEAVKARLKGNDEYGAAFEQFEKENNLEQEQPDDA